MQPVSVWESLPPGVSAVGPEPSLPLRLSLLRGWYPHRVLWRLTTPAPALFLHFLGGCFDPEDFLFVFSSFLFVALKPASPKPPTPEGIRLLGKGGCHELSPPLLRTRQPLHPPHLPHPPPAFVCRRKPAASSLMHPFQWCNGESRGPEGERALGWRENQDPGARRKITLARSPSRAKFLMKSYVLVPKSALYSAEFGKKKKNQV